MYKRVNMPFLSKVTVTNSGQADVRLKSYSKGIGYFLVVLMAMFLALALEPEISKATSIACNQSADLFGSIDLSSGTGSVTNRSAFCSYDIGLASYKEFDNNIEHQTLFASDLRMISPGSTVNLTVPLPPCNYQLDLFHGQLITSFAGGVRYGTARLLSSGEIISLGFCGGNPHPTPNPTPMPAPSCSGITPDGDTIFGSSGIRRTTVTGVSNTNSLYLAVWSEANPSVVYYPATNRGGGVWTGDINIADHPAPSLNHVHVYFTNPGSNTTPCARANFTLAATPDSNPTVSLTADDSSLSFNGSTILRWSSTNATTCSGSGSNNGWTGSRSLSGSFNTGALTSTRTYNITCSNSSGSASDSVTVNVRFRSSIIVITL